MTAEQLARAKVLQESISAAERDIKHLETKVEHNIPVLTFADTGRKDTWHDRGYGYSLDPEFGAMILRCLVADRRLKLKSLRDELAAL